MKRSNTKLRSFLIDKALQVADYKAHGDHLWNRTMYGKVIVRRHGERECVAVVLEDVRSWMVRISVVRGTRVGSKAASARTMRSSSTKRL